jgi:hypothetical protein
MSGEVQEAERLGRIRAILFCMMAVAAGASVLIGLRTTPSTAQLVLWSVMMVLMAANLAGIGGWLKPVSVRRLMNDETTRDHRRSSLSVGFWAMVAAALVLSVTAGRLALTPGDVAQLLATAGLCAAAVGFAVLELRASGG